MAIFSDWHFCHGIQLSPQETASYLNLLTVLRNKNSGQPEMEKALESLRNSSTLHRAYALPVLVDILFSYGERAWYHPDAETEHCDLLIDIAGEIKQCLVYGSSQLEHPQQNPDAMCKLIDNLTDGDFTTLKSELKSVWNTCDNKNGQAGQMQSYLESDKQAAEIVILSIIRGIGRDSPDVLEALMETHLEFWEASYTGRNGMLPQLIALSILGSRKRSFEAILSYLPEDWLMYPEYARLAAETAFGPELEPDAETGDADLESGSEPEGAEPDSNAAPEGIDPGPAMEIGNLLRESANLSFFQQYSYKAFHAESALWFRTEQLPGENDLGKKIKGRSEKQLLCAILWQAVLWEYAVQLDSRTAMARLEKLWCVPSYGRNGKYLQDLYDQKNVNWTAYMLAKESRASIFPDRRAGHEDRSNFAQIVCTPWQQCKEERDANDSFTRYPGMRTDRGALRAFTALCVIRALFDADAGRGGAGGKPINILRLLLNLGAALGIPAVQREWAAHSGNHVWSDTMRGLGLFANGSLMALGTGAVCPSLPQELWKQFVRIARQKAKKGNQQLQLLAGQEGMLICARWAYNAQLSDITVRDRHRRSPWTDYERPLCEYLFPPSEAVASDRIRTDDNALWLYYRTGWYLCQQLDPFCEGNWYEKREQPESAPKTDVYALLRSAQPTWEQWQELTLDKAAFTNEAWLIVLTLRIQSGLASGDTRLELVEEWRDTLFQTMDIWGSPVLFCLLIAMLGTKADHEGDGGKGLDLILQTIVKAVDLSVSEENVGRLYHLIDALPDGEALFGTTTLIHHCSALLVSLEERSRGSALWKDLEYFLLQGLVDRGRNKKYAMETLSRDLNRHWDKRCESIGKKHYVVHEVHNDWQPLTDHFIQNNGEKLQAARQRADLQREDLANGFAVWSTAQDKYTRRLGIICSRKRKAGTVQFSVGFGGAQPEQISIDSEDRSRPDDYAVGSLITYNVKSKRIFPPFMDQPNGTDRFKATLRAITTSDGVDLTGIMPETAEKGKQNEAVLNYWAPNTLAFLNGRYPLGQGVRCQITYDEQMQTYLPIERGFFRLLMDQFYGRGSEGPVELYYIESPFEQGKDSALFSVSPGFNYRLDLQDWDEESRKAVRENLIEKANALGVKVTVQLTVRDGFPYLTITGFDFRNQNWAELFDLGEVYIARRNKKTNSYQIEQMTENGPVRVNAYLEPGGSQDVHNVQLAPKGWNLTRQRQRGVLVEPCRKKFIPLKGDGREQYRQIKEILDLKAGDIVPMQAAFGSRGITGYGTAFISRFGLRALCSLESLSLVPELAETGAFAKNRKCIVERVFDISNVRRRTAKPFTPAYPLEGSVLTGIVTEIADINGESIEHSVIKATFLYQDDDVRRLDIPYTAFDVPPQHSGSEVRLSKGEDGWTATATVREIRVRALWDGEWHEDGGMEGVYLGEFTLPGQSRHRATQDCGRPVIHFWPYKTRVKGKEQLCGIPAKEIADGRKRPPVVETHYLRSDAAAFQDMRYRSTAYFEYNKRTYWGEAASGHFKNSSSMWYAAAEITPVASTELYDLRRIFRKRSPTENEAQLRQREEVDEDNARWFKEWYHAGDWHLEGTIQNGRFRIRDNRKLPIATNGECTKGLLPSVPFYEKEPLWYRKSADQYQNNCEARVKIMICNGQWAASCRQTEPIPMGKELADRLGPGAEEIIKNYTLYFAGVTAEGKLRLEWGYGYTTVVDSENVVDINGGMIGPTLFFGDRITEFMIHDCDGVWKLCVINYKRGTEYYVWRDAVSCNIVHLMKVRVIKEKNIVRILNISQTTSEIGESGTPRHSWGWQTSYNVRLDKESIQLLLEEAEESAERYIFAQFLISDEVDSRYQREQLFHYISLKKDGSLLQELRGKRVCLTAGLIYSNYRKNQQSLGNDYMLKFYLPNELPLSDSDMPNKAGPGRKPSITVTVMRRNFSIDESKMRVSHYQHKADAFHEYQMLVCLVNERKYVGTHEWIGSVLSTPLRSTASLIKWVQGQPGCIVSLGNELSEESVVLAEGPSPEAGRIDTAQVEVEVSPGILSKIAKENIEGAIHRGAIAQLMIVDDELKARVLLASDRTYIPETGRAVELLVMDDAAKQFRPGAENESKRAKHDFTVAGFPQLQLKSNLLERMMHKPWPRVGFIKPDGDTLSVYETDHKNSAMAAEIWIDDETHRPSLYYFEAGRPIQSDWSKLSFMDSDSAAIAQAAKKSVWHYHDKCYAQLDQDGAWNVQPLPDGSNYREIVVFPDKRDRLRIKPSEFKQYGYSAREIIEYGLPEGRSSFPVAGTDQDSIWIEIYPGRIVELPKAMLFVGKKRAKLDTLRTSMLSSGDEVVLDSHDFSFKGGQRMLAMIGVKYGLRAYAPKSGYIFLPVREAVNGGLRLGGGCWHMTYPCATDNSTALRKSVAISQDNVLTLDWQPRCGDTVFVRMEGNSLHAETDPEYDVYIDRKAKNWAGAQWLYEWLNNATMRKAFFSAIGNVLPMTVAAYVSDNKPIFAYYAQPDERCYQVGDILCCAVLGLITEDETHYVILRAGKLLLRVPYPQLLPGFPIESALEVIHYLREYPNGIWIHKSEYGWRSGIYSTQPAGKAEVYLLGWLAAAHGIICFRADSMSLTWLPIGLAAFVEPASKHDPDREGQIWKALKKAYEYKQEEQKTSGEYTSSALDAMYILKEGQYREGGGGEISLVDANPSNRSLMPRVKRRAIPLVKIQNSSMYACIAELYPHGSLFELYSEYDRFDWGKPQPVVISQKTKHAVKAVMEGSMHERIKLSSQLCAYFDKKNLSNGMQENVLSEREPSIFEEAEEYLAQYRWGVSDAKNGCLSDLSSMRASVEGKLLHLWTYTQEDRENGSWRGFRYICGYLKEWLEQPETQQMLGLGKSRKPFPAVPVCGVVTAALLMNLIAVMGIRNAELRANAGKLSVHIVRMLGLACEASIQQEVLAECAEQHKRGGLWERLYILTLGGERSDGASTKNYLGTLSQPQYNRMVSTCKYILQNSMTDDRELLLVAESLLYSVGELENYDSFEAHLNYRPTQLITWKLGKIGRTLVPKESDLTAFDHLPNIVYYQLKAIWSIIYGREFKSAYLYLDLGTEKLFNGTQRGELENLVKNCINSFAKESRII